MLEKLLQSRNKEIKKLDEIIEIYTKFFDKIGDELEKDLFDNNINTIYLNIKELFSDATKRIEEVENNEK